MEKSYFTTLCLDTQADLTWNYGEFIIAVENTDRFYILFLLDNFYVEIHVGKDTNELEEITIQEDSDILYEYIKELDIHEITDYY